MNNTEESESADIFIEQNPEMLDSKIMMSHYSAELLFSDKARKEFVELNLDPIPGHSRKQNCPLPSNNTQRAVNGGAGMGQTGTNFFDPVTVAERIEFDKYDEDYLVMVLIKKAQQPDGSPFFTLTDRRLLLNKAAASVVARVANRILAADAIDAKLL